MAAEVPAGPEEPGGVERPAKRQRTTLTAEERGPAKRQRTNKGQPLGHGKPPLEPEQVVPLGSLKGVLKPASVFESFPSTA